MYKIKLQFLVSAVMLVTAATASAEFYYSGGRQIPLKVDSLKVTIKFDAALPDTLQDSLLAAIDRIAQVVEDIHLIDDFIACSLSTGMNYYSLLDSLAVLPGLNFVEPYYVTVNDTPMVVGQHLFVGFDPAVPRAEIDSINQFYGVEIVDSMMQTTYLLRMMSSTPYRVLDLANLYYELPQTRFSHPNFSIPIARFAYRLYDYYHSYQWHIKRVIGEFNSASVWDFAGLQDTVKVAVIDDGVASHEDLYHRRVLSGYDFVNNIPSGYPYYTDGHGMGCAGIIAAGHTTDSVEGTLTSSGVISLNPNTDILPVKIFDSSQAATPWGIAAAINYAWQNGAEVLNNSWGNTIEGYEYQGITRAIDSAYTYGRNGLGCPLIFATGNQWYEWISYPAILPTTFAVGASHYTDYRWDYSQYGPELDVVAPSGYTCLWGDVWTLDQMMYSGYNIGRDSICGHEVEWDCGPSGNDMDYDCYFGGTSAACAIVSGVASLILAKDSTLPVDTVYDILRHSAQTELMFDTITPPDLELGYGRVDAFRAILSLSHGNVDNQIGPGGEIDVADLTYLVAYLFQGHAEPFPSLLLGDCDCNGDVDVNDLTYLVAFLFGSGPAPVRPCYAF